METLCLFVDVPVCAFRPNWSREYQDTHAFPPPSTVYGMLLSLAGVDWPRKGCHAGVQFALALQGEPEKACVFRKFRRVPRSSKSADPLASRRPDYQDLLLWLKLWVWLRDGSSSDSLVEKVRIALAPSERGKIKRYGGVSLGESSHLVNEISLRKPAGQGCFLYGDREGYLSLPVWVHHPRCGRGETKVERFSIGEPESLMEPPIGDTRWIRVTPEK